MSKRPFDSEFWRGKYVRSLSPLETFVYVYLINSPENNISGIYDEQIDIFEFDLKMPASDILPILEKLESDGKIMRFESHIAILKWGKHQSESPTVTLGMARIMSELSDDFMARLRECYELPKGCTWKKIDVAISRLNRGEKIYPNGTPKVPPPGGILPIPNLTKPLPLGGGGLVGGGNQAATPPAAAGSDGGMFPLELSEKQLDKLNEEFPDIQIDDEYEKLKGTPVRAPMAYMRKTFARILANQKKGE